MRIRRTPTTTRYAAPISFTVVKAVADEATSAESPTVAAATWTKPPLETPSAETRPARRPLSTLWVTMYVTAGPGTIARATEASEKSATVCRLGSTTTAGRYPRGMPKTVTGAELELDDAPARDSELFIVDGNNLAYRAFFALPEELQTTDGQPTNALLGFTNMLFKLLADYRPKGVAVAWDSRPVHRAAVAEAGDVVYKEGRRSMPELLREQFPHFRPIVEAFGYVNLEFEGWEADDVIATLATRADAEGIKTCVVSTDRDAFQLCSANISPDDDAARRRRCQRLHARACRSALRRDAGAGARLHRSEGRHLRQHSWCPGHRRQDGRPVDRAVRIARVGDRARRRPLTGAVAEHHRARGAGAPLEGARNDAARPRHRLRPESSSCSTRRIAPS